MNSPTNLTSSAAGGPSVCQTVLMKPPETMEARLLDLLRREWVTPITALQKVGCFSLSQRVGEFIREGIAIEKTWIDLPSGKRVRAYRVA